MRGERGAVTMPSGTDATELLASRGDERAADRLLTLVYDELHELADGYMRRERSDHTLQPTALRGDRADPRRLGPHRRAGLEDGTGVAPARAAPR